MATVTKEIPKFILDAAAAGAPKGERNNRALWLAAQIRDAGIGRGDAEQLMAQFAASCNPAMKPSEVAAVMKSANTRPPRAPPASRVNDEVIGWDDTIGPRGDRKAAAAPDYVEDVPPPGASELADLRAWLAALYKPDDIINYVCSSEKTEDGGWVPSGRGASRTRSAIEADLDKYERKGLRGDAVIRAALGDYKPEAGMWARLNPTDGKGCNDRNIVRFDHALVEGDKQSVGQQLAVIRSLGLPCAAITHSGGKSVHAVVRVDAGTDKALFAERVTALFAACEAAGLVVDKPNRNPSRLSRIAGPVRGGKRQYLIESGGGGTWAEWETARRASEFRDTEMTVDTLAVRPPDDNLLGNRFLTRSGSWMIVAQSGIGKSSFAIQGAASFAVGRPMFGMVPARPMRQVIIQAENNAGDTWEAYDGVIGGLALAESERAELRRNFVIKHCSRYSGARFCEYLAHVCRRHKPDIVWIDPLLSYIGGEISRMDDCSRFLQHSLQPVIEDADIGLIVMHHTGKPPKKQEDGYQGDDLAYLGIGSSLLTDWARATSTILRDPDDRELFWLAHGKRGGRAGCEARQSVRHSKGRIFWVPGVEDKRQQGQQQKTPRVSRSQYDGMGLEIMPPLAGPVAPGYDPATSPAVQWVSARLAEAGIGKTPAQVWTLIRNKKLEGFLVFDRALGAWRGKLWSEEMGYDFG